MASAILIYVAYLKIELTPNFIAFTMSRCWQVSGLVWLWQLASVDQRHWNVGLVWLPNRNLTMWGTGFSLCGILRH